MLKYAQSSVSQKKENKKNIDRKLIVAFVTRKMQIRKMYKTNIFLNFMEVYS